MTKMWMVRGDGGSMYESFRERGVVAVGWPTLAAYAKPGVAREDLIALYQQHEPQSKPGTARAGASQLWRFVNEVAVGDWVVTYSPINRRYAVGKITGPAQYYSEWVEEGFPTARSVAWQAKELPRDSLSIAAKNSLGSVLTVFEVPHVVAEEIRGAFEGTSLVAPTTEVEESEETQIDPLAEIETQALERIKDRVNELGWDEMQHLVAGILRAMGYKTQISPAGSDRGKDIVASPDGFGFEHPRIVVEVKHRKERMDSQQIRSFLGGRHKDDRGLYVSTGGFSKDALYEAERASIPLQLWTLDHLVRALIEHYDQTDAETKRIVPLKRLYWPA